jgi:aldehyde:ferredoxin oxidoreductase
MTPLVITSRAALAYQRSDVDKGYTNHYLDVDLSAGTIAIHPIDEQTKKTFIGGKGFDLWLLWQAVSGDTRWSDPQNAVCIASGPMGGTPAYPGSGKSIVTSISPLTGSVIDSNVGGYSLQTGRARRYRHRFCR